MLENPIDYNQRYTKSVVKIATIYTLVKLADPYIYDLSQKFSVVQHVSLLGPKIDLDKLNLLKKCNNMQYVRCFLEHVLYKNLRNKMNIGSGTLPSSITR